MSLAPGENSWVAICNFRLLDFFACGLHAPHIGKVHPSKCTSCPRKTLLFPNSVEQFFTKPPLELSKVLRFQRKVPSAASPAVPGIGIACEDLTWRWLLNALLLNPPWRLRKSIFFRFSNFFNSGARFAAATKENQWFFQFLIYFNRFWTDFFSVFLLSSSVCWAPFWTFYFVRGRPSLAVYTIPAHEILESCCSSRKSHVYSTLWHFSVIPSWLSLSRPRFLTSFCSAF